MTKKVNPVAEAPKAKKAKEPKFFEGAEVVAVNDKVINGKDYKEVTTIKGQSFLLSPEDFKEQVN